MRRCRYCGVKIERNIAPANVSYGILQWVPVKGQLRCVHVTKDDHIHLGHEPLSETEEVKGILAKYI